MALIIEDGTGKTNSESFTDIAYADIYHSNRGNALWGNLTNVEKEQGLRKATFYLCFYYRAKLKGEKTSNTQALEMPRTGIDITPTFILQNNIIPNDWKDATSELALKSRLTDLIPEDTRGVKKEKIDVIEITYDDKSTVVAGSHSIIDLMLGAYLKPGSSADELADAATTNYGFGTETVKLG